MAESNPTPRLNTALEGRYRIERDLGEGGMAMVYLAADLKHGRRVAIKVLRPELAAVVGAERFLTEIETTANLQHPHILPLFDSGEADGLLFYVMPYVEGESLGDRLDREHQLPVDDAVRIATNLAEALDYAHRQGVIHRDIKPANVLLQDGKPIISDFGIALAIGAAGGGRLTETGLSVGTPHYMSPEQAMGDLNLGPPTDVYALGCVLYEMLVGEPPFTGSTPQAVLGKIITGDRPSANAERGAVPSNVDAVIAKALEKVPADRFTGAGDFVKALADPGFRYGVGSHSARPTSGSRMPALTTVALAGIAVVAAALLMRPPEALSVAGSISLPEGEVLSTVATRMLDLSPDGMTVAYNSTGVAGERQVYLRRLSDFETRAVPGSLGAGSILFSPDGQSILYSMGTELRMAPVAGGPPLMACTADCFGITFGSWRADTIIYTPFGAGLSQRLASDGESTPLTTLDVDAGELDHVWPETLPGGAILYGVRFSTGAEEVRLLSDDGSRTVVSGTSQARYTNGWLLYAVGSSLFAVEFEPTEGTTAGEAFLLLDDLWVDGRAAFAVGGDGTLVYVPASASADGRALVRVSREGEPTVVSSGGLQFERPRLSPVDSTLLLFTDHGDLWTFDIASKVERRLTNGGDNDSPIWAPGDRVLYGSSQDGIRSIYMKSADERTDGRKFLESEQEHWPDDVTPDGSTLVFSQRGPATDGDIWMVPFEAGAEPTLLLGDEFTTWPGGVSPDGRWLAYVTNRDGRFEVYVTDFPDLVSHRRLSIGEGMEPAWSPAGGELFYRDGTRMMVVAYRTDEDGDFAPEPARELFEGSFLGCCPGLAQYAVAADGQSFFMLQGTDPREIRFWRGWERQAASGR